MRNIKLIAFYLPQFHAIPENDKWWGQGFTEWTNVKKALPLIKNHYQPKEPLDDNYYCLLDDGVMEKQAQCAKKYGIYGFCYYHYWFGNGKKLLEKPIEKMLNNSNIDMPYCLCWANENWSRNWDGGNKEIIQKQDYGNEKTWDLHLKYLINFFKDPRYIRLDGNPVFVIYRPELIPAFNQMIEYWKERIKGYGFETIVIISQYPQIFREQKTYSVDYKIKFEPTYVHFHCEHKNYFSKKFAALQLGTRKIRGLTIIDYDKAWNYILNKEFKGSGLIPGAFTDWDNTARNRKGILFKGATPEKFEKYLGALVEQVEDNCYPLDFVFINAWNEWGEGCYLEPDKKHGYAYLNAILNIMNRRATTCGINNSRS